MNECKKHPNLIVKWFKPYLECPVCKLEAEVERLMASKRFKPPTLQEVRDYIAQKDYPVDPDQFFNFYEAKGWMIGKNKMKNWHAAVRTWLSKNKTKLYPITGKICSKEGCGLPAVYKDTTGSYDHYYCAKHLPEKVRKLYQ